ncbi:MAG: response regulator [Burkholderiaceae bacterium]
MPGFRSDDVPALAPRPVVLVCDDDRIVLATLAGALGDAGYEVIEADNGDDAILLARQHRPSIALLDMRMDGKSGLDVAAYLRDYVGTPFVFLSALGDESLMARAREFGALDYLVKPVDVDTIAAAVAEALRRSASRDAAAARRDTLPTDAALVRAVAVGILMERLSLARAAAEARLAVLAREVARTEAQLADELVRGFDLLDRGRD